MFVLTEWYSKAPIAIISLLLASPCGGHLQNHIHQTVRRCPSLGEADPVINEKEENLKNV